MQAPHVLVLPSFYSDPEKPQNGVFFREQAMALQRNGVRIGIVYVEPRSLRVLNLKTLREHRFQVNLADEEGLITLRMRGWNPLLRTTPGGLVWAWLTKCLVDRYVASFGIPDLLHAHNALWAGYAARGVARKLRIPYLVTEHNTAFLLREVPRAAGEYVRKTYEDANATLAVSNGLASSMIGYLAGKGVTVVPNLVKTEYFTLPPVPRIRRPFVILGIAFLTERKGFHLLVKAFAERFRTEPDVRLEIGGDGPQRQRLEVLCRTLGVDSQVRFLGALSREQVRAAMWSANAFVLPSTCETFGVVLIEALSTGLPVIATSCGGPEDFVTPDVGIIVPPGNEEELAHALERVWKCGEYPAQALRDLVVMRFGEQPVAKMIHGIYRSVLESWHCKSGLRKP